MVTQVTSFSRNGLSDWLIQRVSSLILLAYFLFIGVQIATGIDYTSWRALHDTTAMKVFTCLLYTSPSPRDYAASRMPSSA